MSYSHRFSSSPFGSSVHFLCLSNRPFQKTCGQSVTHMLPILVKYVNQSIQKWAKKNFLKALFHKFYAVYSSKKHPSQIPDSVLNETMYSRMDQVKFLEDSL